MPEVTYRAAPSEGRCVLWGVLAGGLIAAGTALAIIQSDWMQQPWPFVRFLALLVAWTAPLALGTWFGQRWAARHQRARVAEIAKVLAREGFRVDQEPWLARRSAHFERWSQAMQKILLCFGDPLHGTWLAWEVNGTLDRPQGAIFAEYSFPEAPGDDDSPIRAQTVLAWPAEHSDVAEEWARLPAVLVARRTMWDRSHYVTTEIPAWDLHERLEGWVFYGSPEGAGRLASAQRSFFTALKRSAEGEGWHFGNGWIAAIYHGRLEAEGLAGFFAHAREVLAAMHRP